MNPKVTDDDNGEITVTLDGKELRGWSYRTRGEQREKMACAREYVEGWCDGRETAREAPWANIPKHYVGQWGYDHDEKNSVFFVHCGGHRILDAEDSEVAHAVCLAFNRDNPR